MKMQIFYLKKKKKGKEKGAIKEIRVVQKGKPS